METDVTPATGNGDASATDDLLAPVDYLVVEFPAGREPDGSVLVELLDLVHRGLIRVFDLTFVQRGVDGSVTALSIEDLGLAGEVDTALFADAASGLLDEADLADAGGALEPGRSAAVLVYENRWAAPFATALRRTGADLVASGRIPPQAILATLDELEPADR